MVTVLKDIPIPGIEVIPCRLNGPRGIVKTFLLHDATSLVLIDTGFSDADAYLIVERLAKLGRTPADLTMCILTHKHGDHVGGLKKLREQGNFAVVAHEDEAAGVEQTCGVAVERTVKDGDDTVTAKSFSIQPRDEFIVAMGDSSASGEGNPDIAGALGRPGKPEEVVEKMLEGRMRNFYKETVLLQQTFVIDNETQIAKVLENASKDLGAPISVEGFVRFQVGESAS